MNYIGLIVRLSFKGRWTNEDAWIADIFKDALISCGFESFVDTASGFEAYCPEGIFSLNEVVRIERQELGFVENLKVGYETEVIEQKDWNAEWEKNYEAVRFSDFCIVRPPFKPAQQDVQYDIVIEPKMSFGTAHHQTTSLIVEFLSEEEVKGKSVMDMGCGTGVLAILCAKMGAACCEAIDNDTWAAENARENVERNSVSVKVSLGDANDLDVARKYDIFIANINRNILLDNMESYSSTIANGGVLFLSGFYSEDVPCLEKKCAELGFTLDKTKTKDNWAAVRFVKK